MNTANLQFEGLLLALASLIDLLKRKGVATQAEIDEALAEAERTARADPMRPEGLSAANVEAICFPIRFLAAAIPGGEHQPFSAIAAEVGRAKNAKVLPRGSDAG